MSNFDDLIANYQAAIVRVREASAVCKSISESHNAASKVRNAAIDDSDVAHKALHDAVYASVGAVPEHR